MPHPFRAAVWTMLGFQLLAISTAAKPLEPAAILMKADYILTPKGSFEYSGSVSVQGREGEGRDWEFKASVQDPLHRRLVFDAPPAEKGQSLLLDGEKFWLYLPKLKKAVRVPPNIPLAGEISYADLGQPFFSMGYQAILAEIGTLEGAPVYVLRLIPRSKNSLYSKVKLWVKREDFRPIQAEYFGERGLRLKICRFEDFQEELGMERPLRWVYQDAADPAKRTVLTMGGMNRKNFDSKAFEPHSPPELFSSPALRPKSASAPTPRPPRPERRSP